MAVLRGGSSVGKRFMVAGRVRPWAAPDLGVGGRGRDGLAGEGSHLALVVIGASPHPIPLPGGEGGRGEREDIGDAEPVGADVVFERALRITGSVVMAFAAVVTAVESGWARDVVFSRESVEAA